jgi:hypothetical protein
MAPLHAILESRTMRAPRVGVTPGQSAVLYDGEVCLGVAVVGATEAARIVQDAARRGDSSTLIR